MLVGPLRIGMSMAEAERLLYEIEGAVAAKPGARRNPGFADFESGMSIQIAPDGVGGLRSVEIYRPLKDVRVLCRGISVFETPADELIRVLSAEVRLEIEDGGLAVIAPDLLLAFGRDVLSNEADGRYFDWMLVAKPGYYDEYEPEVWPSGKLDDSMVTDPSEVDDGQGSLFRPADVVSG